MDNEPKPIIKNSSLSSDISNILLLNASFIDNIGLMHGKMGISICFYHLARQTGNKIYEDYAGELIDEIYDEITVHIPVDFENGLAGIGWGIEYLVQNGFIEADTDDVLEEFDNRIFKELIYNTPHDIGLLKGFIGLGAYFLKRIKNTGFNYEKESTLTKSLIHIVDELEHKILKNIEILKEPLNPIKNLHTPKPSNLAITEFPDFKQTTNNEPQTYGFDLTWNYPMLLWFLSELHEQKIFIPKTKEILKRLLKILTEEKNHPQLQSNRLLLALSLTKYKANKQSNYKTFEFSNIKSIIDCLFFGINRNILKSELPRNNVTLRYGTSGIAWIYKQLHSHPLHSDFNKELEHWQELTIKAKSNDITFVPHLEKENAFGILEGLAGILALINS